jgi:hypothetical protein
MSLQQEIDEGRKEIRTDGYPISVGEWISLYENNEIDIHPEFQRFYRWTHGQKTRLIESLLLVLQREVCQGIAGAGCRLGGRPG